MTFGICMRSLREGFYAPFTLDARSVGHGVAFGAESAAS